MERLGLGYEAVAARSTRASSTARSPATARTGRAPQEAGHDINYQAGPACCPCRPGPRSADVPAALVADIAGGAMPAVINILLALRQRDLTGEGCRLDIAMTDAMFTFAWLALAEGLRDRALPGRGRTCSPEAARATGSTRRADGQFLAVGALEEKFWARLLRRHRARQSRCATTAPIPRATRAAVAAIVRGRTRGRLAARSSSRSIAAAPSCVRSRRPWTTRISAARGLFAATAAGRRGRAIPAGACRSRRTCAARRDQSLARGQLV